MNLICYGYFVTNYSIYNYKKSSVCKESGPFNLIDLRIAKHRRLQQLEVNESMKILPALPQGLMI